MRCIVLLSVVSILLTGCDARQSSLAEYAKERERDTQAIQEQQRRSLEETERAIEQHRRSREENASAEPRGNAEFSFQAIENARFIRERAYCAISPEWLANLYNLLNAGDPERAAAIADLSGAVVLEPNTRILVLEARPFYKGLGANLIRVGQTRLACYVPNTALKTR